MSTGALLFATLTYTQIYSAYMYMYIIYNPYQLVGVLMIVILIVIFKNNIFRLRNVISMIREI